VKDQTPTLASCLRSMFVQEHLQGLRDSALLGRFVAFEDPDAFVALMRRHGPMILSLARRVVRDHQMAEDVFQAAFLVLSRKARAVRGQESLPAWLHTVAFRLALRTKKSRKRFADVDSGTCPAFQGDPSDDLARRESLTILDEELHNLPDKYQVPLILCHLEGLSHEAAAKRLNLSAGSLKGRLERGRALLRTMLARRGLGADTAALGLVPSLPLVSPVLVQSTLRAAMTGQGASLAAAALASGAIKMMFLAKLKTAALAVLLLGAVGWGAGWVALGAGGVQKEEAAAPASLQLAMAAPPLQAKVKAVDLYGDPLPEGAVMRFGTVQLRAAGAKLAVSADGKTLIGVRGGKYLSFWEVESGKLKESRELPTAGGSDAVLSSDGRLLATGRLEVFEVRTGKLVQKLDLQGYGYPGCTAFSPDGSCLATVHAKDGVLSIRVWRLESGKETFAQEIKADTNPVFSSFTPDGKKLLASFMAPEIGTCCWDVATSQMLWQNKSNGWNPSPFPVFSADGKTIFSLRPPLNVDTGQTAQIEKTPGGFGSLLTALPDGHTFLISGAEGVRVWDMASDKVLRTLAGAGDEMYLAPDGKTLITNNGLLQRWDLRMGKALYPDNFDEGHTQEVTTLVFSASGQHLASAASDGSVRLWDAATGRPTHVWRGHDAARPIPFSTARVAGVQALDMTSDGRWIVSVGSEERLRAWDGITGKEVCTILLPEKARGEQGRHVYHLRISPDGKKAMALFGAQGHVFRSDQAFVFTDWLAHWDLQKGVLLTKRPMPFAGSSSLSPNAKTLISGHDVTNLETAKKVSQIEDDRKYYTTVSNARDAISQDGSLIVGECTKAKEKGEIASDGVAVWETATGKRIAHFKTNNSCQLAFHPNMRLVAVDDYSAGILLWDVATSAAVATRKMPGGERSNSAHGSLASCMAFTPDGRHLATGHPDGTILLWPVDLPSPNPVRLTPNEIDSLWSTLKDADAAKAWQAVWRLADAPEDAVPFLRKMLKPVPGAPKDITGPQLIDLGSDVFAKRETATKRLKDLGLLAEPALRQSLSANPPLELRQRIEALLKSIVESPPGLTPEVLQTLRAVAVLSRIQSPQARQILEDLAKGVESAPLTLAAKAVLGS
jgi:RNA polymerase sigma factor (sigma-70 family)